jgi:hypothetical protein
MQLRGRAAAAAALRNYTAFARNVETNEQVSASAVPIPSISLRSFVSLPVLFDLFGWLPSFDWARAILVIVDVLLIAYTHVHTVRGVATLLRGHLEDDHVVRDDDASVARACGCACGAALAGLCLRSVDLCETFLRRHRAIVVKAASVFVRAILGLIAVALFAIGMWLLAEVASSLITVQALDGIGVIGAIVAPVTAALGAANVKSIENARVINSQTLLTAQNAYDQALHELAALTDEFNDDQERDLALFNDEYCALQATLRAYNGSVLACVPVPQILATVSLEPCQSWQEVVPRLFVDVGRNEYRARVLSTIEPFVTALRTMILDCVWFVAYVIIGVACVLVLGTALYFALVAVHMIRVRKRVIFASKGALQTKYTTRKGLKHAADDGDSLSSKSRSTSARSHPELVTVCESGENAQKLPQKRSSRRSSRRSRRSNNVAGAPLPPPLVDVAIASQT